MLTLPRILIGAVALALVVVGIAAAGWWFFIREDAELATNAPEIPADLQGTSAAGTPGSGSSPGTQTFRVIADRSEAAYFADEKLASLPVPSTAKGSTNEIAGEFHLTEDGLALDTTKTSSFTVTLTNLKSDKEMRDRRVHGQALETERFPTATFTMTDVSGYNPDIPAGEEQTLQLTGMMDLHGVQKELTWEVKARREGDVITALATVNFLYSDFNIPVLNIANFVSVEEDVTLQVQLVAQRA